MCLKINMIRIPTCLIINARTALLVNINKTHLSEALSASSDLINKIKLN